MNNMTANVLGYLSCSRHLRPGTPQDSTAHYFRRLSQNLQPSTHLKT